MIDIIFWEHENNSMGFERAFHIADLDYDFVLNRW